MTTMQSAFYGRVLPTWRTGAVLSLLLASVLLAGCAGTKSAPAVVPQGGAGGLVAKPSQADAALLVDGHGVVEVKTGDDGPWALASAGQTIQSGQNVRTGALSNVALVFYDGSRVYLGAGAEIILEVLDARTTGARVVQLTQMSGESQHTVAPASDPGSRYLVNTPTGNGSATSTTFTVMVLPGQLSQFWVEAGDIAVSSADASVTVVAGQTTISRVGQPPSAPVFRITGEGQVMPNGAVASEVSVKNTTHLLSAPMQADKVTLCHATGSATNPYVVITVAAAGASHGHAKHAGDIIPAPADGCPNATAPLALPADWNIAGQTFRTEASTVIFGNPQPGDWVRFEGRLQPDGSHFADRIVVVSHNPQYLFTFMGKVEAISASTWTIAQRVVQVTEATAIEPGLKVGDSVQVAGKMADDGGLWAARLSRTTPTGANFRFAGILSSLSQNVWVISGINVAVGVSTTLDSDFVVGNPVVVEGVLLDDGTWLATTINLVTPEGYHFEFVGPVQSLSPWTVAGVSFDVVAWTEIDSGIRVGDQVRVMGMVNADGLWVAEQITRLSTEQTTRFDFFGPVLGINPWNVRGVVLVVDARTAIKGDIVLGEMVKVTGWILEDGTWLATEIKHTGLHLGQGCFMVSNVVQSFTAEQIVLLDGQTLMRTPELELQGDLKEASVVRYQFCMDDHGQGKVTHIYVVYQFDAMPVGLWTKRDCQDGPDHDQGKGNDCNKDKDKKDKNDKGNGK